MAIDDFDYLSAQARSSEKLGLTLRWLYKWELTSRHAISELLGTKKSTTYETLSRYRKLGLVSSFTMSNVPGQIYHLTKRGVAVARELFVGHKDEYLTTAFYPSKINTNHAAHDFLTQHAVLRYLEAYPKARFLTDRQLRLREKKFLRESHKIPDAVLHLGSHKRPHQILIEVQESPLSSHRLELMLSLYAEAILQGEIQGMVLASTRHHILNHAKQIVARGVRHFDFLDGRWSPINLSVTASPLSPDMIGDSIIIENLDRYEKLYYRHIIR